MSTLGQFFGGGSHVTRFERIFMASGSFVTPFAGKYLVTAIGGGGAGGGRGSTNSMVGAGGGAGGFSQRLVTLAAGETISYTVGAGGIANSGAAGGNGGTSTITAGGFTCTANGGTGGVASITANVAETPGGTASGGTVNVTGGGGSGYYVGTGSGGPGGAVGVYGKGHTAHIAGAIAGAGVGGSPSGEWPGTAIMSGADLVTLYGSTAPVNGSDPTWTLAVSSTMFDALSTQANSSGFNRNIGGYAISSTNRFLEPTGGILTNNLTNTTRAWIPGAGVGAFISGQAPGAFAGGCLRSAVSPGYSGGIGGGGGSGASGGDTTSRAGGAGGTGLVVIEWFAAI